MNPYQYLQIARDARLEGRTSDYNLIIEDLGATDFDRKKHNSWNLPRFVEPDFDDYYDYDDNDYHSLRLELISEWKQRCKSADLTSWKRPVLGLCSFNEMLKRHYSPENVTANVMRQVGLIPQTDGFEARIRSYAPIQTPYFGVFPVKDPGNDNE